jgi:hypothetical protein
MNPDITISRLKRRIEKKNKTILGLQRRVQQLESALANRTLDLGNLSRNIRREVQDALCNVRFIPVSTTLRTANIKINENI